MYHKIIINLLNREIEHRLIYVALSKATKFSNIGLKDKHRLSKNRVCW